MKITRGIKISKVFIPTILNKAKPQNTHPVRRERDALQIAKKTWNNLNSYLTWELIQMLQRIGKASIRPWTSSGTWKICRTQHRMTQPLWVLLLVLQSPEQGEDGGRQQPRDPLGRCYRAITVPCYRENLSYPADEWLRQIWNISSF